jgi:WhiB family transcriptional regulator, redox-sensing transcriptional regulator
VSRGGGHEGGRPRINTIVGDETWREQAACHGRMDVSFFPNAGESATPAKAVCAGCPVRVACLDYALVNGETDGVWGGMDEEERRKERRERRRAGALHGTRTCYQAGCNRPECRQANTRHVANRRSVA